jgi:hypothetical protein
MIRRFVIALVGCSLLLALYAEVQRLDDVTVDQLDHLHARHVGEAR